MEEARESTVVIRERSRIGKCKICGHELKTGQHCPHAHNEYIVFDNVGREQYREYNPNTICMCCRRGKSCEECGLCPKQECENIIPQISEEENIILTN